MIQELANRIWSHMEFHSEYRDLIRRGIRISFPTIQQENTPSDVRRVIQSAAHLSGSSSPLHREAAYRIGVYAARLVPADWNSMSDVLAVILGRLGNYPAIEHLDRVRGKQEGISSIPFSTAVDIAYHRAANTVHVSSSVERVLTDFQRRLWQKLEEPHATAVSAPTSAGKSFALLNYVASRLYQQPKSWALFIVPTRALIGQVTDALTALFGELGIGGSILVTEIPTPPKEQGATGGVYVLTQERAQILLESAEAPVFSLVISDEAQGVADDGRGILLQTVIERLLSRNPVCKILFSAPLVSNPSIFGTIFDLPDLEPIVEQESPVAQNLIFVDSDPIRRNIVRLSFVNDGERRSLGELEVPIELMDDDQALAVVAATLGAGKQNIVYAGGKAKCETLAGLVMDLVKSDDEVSELQDLSQFVRNHVHRDYLLADTVQHRVAFHYGNMPAVVRKELEHFSSTGVLRYLVCTSTLLQGINLPATNLFLLKPTKGRDWQEATDIPLDGGDFWNLAGRAGRLGKEFEGNVFLLDTSRWQSQPFAEPREQPVLASFNKIVSDKLASLIDFIGNKDHASGRRDQAGIENTFVKLANAYRAGSLDVTLDRVFEDGTAPARQAIQNAIMDAVASISVRQAVLERNPTISLFRQQEMYDYLRKRISEGKTEEIIPIHPLRSEAYKSILRLFKRVHTYFEKKEGKDKSHTFFTTLALKWMRGEPLPMIIDENYKQRLKNAKRGTPAIATVIRETLDLIESDLRFRYVKFVKCYVDLLVAALEDSGQVTYLSTIPPLHLFLELGASSETMLNLIGIGLTRTSAGIVSQVAPDKGMDRVETFRWLANTNWPARNIPAACLREVSAVIASRA